MEMILAIVAALGIGIAVGVLYVEIKHMRERIAALELAAARHLPYKAADNMENGIAVINYQIIDKETEIDWYKGQIKKLEDDIVMTRRGLEYILKARNGKEK